MGLDSTGLEVAWKPLPGSQSLALTAPTNHILFEGGRGGGKTDAQLLRFYIRVGKGFGPHWRGIIFDRQYKSLDDLVAKSKRWFPKFAPCKWYASKSDYKWVWPSGEELLFRHMDHEDDYNNYHGHEYPYIGWNELTKWPDSSCYDAMMSTNRSSFLPTIKTPFDIPLEVFSTTNPHGVGHNWVKAKFIDPAPPGKILPTTTEVFNPRTQQNEKVTKTQVRIFSSYRENRYLSPEYVAELMSISEPNKRKAWLDGDWDIVSGSALGDLWNTEVHRVEQFKVPPNWPLFRSFDWGSSHPYSVGFWTISNGEEYAPGKSLPKGSLVRVSEIYGAKSVTVHGQTSRFGHNKGSKEGAKTIARKILEHEATLRKKGWVAHAFDGGPADNEIFAVKNSDVLSIGRQMGEEGVGWSMSNKGPGTRRQGLQLLRDRLEASLNGDQDGLYVMAHCEAFLRTVPSLPRSTNDPDDVDTQAEDHVYDETRYAVLHKHRPPVVGLKLKTV